MRSFHALVDLVLPSRCAGCAAPGGAWCPDCARTLLTGPLPVKRPGLPPAFALSAYRGAARRAVLAYKERARRELATRLGQALATAVPTVVSAAASEAHAGPLVLLPAPSRPAAARQRGGQHMVAVAKHCADSLCAAGIAATVWRALRLDGRAVDSVGLDAVGRAANLAGRLRPLPGRSPPPNAHVLLLDDVITTGATAAACVAALTSTGTTVTAVLTITVAG